MKTLPVDQTVNEGADFVQFNCTFLTNTMPVPSVSWTFTNNDGHTKTVKETSTFGQGTRTSIVKMMSVSRNEGGRYDCVVENEIHKNTSSAHLTVQCK